MAMPAAVPPIEPVYAASVSREGLTVRLASGGCTRKADLSIAIAKGERPVVLIARRRPDPCRADGPGHADILWTWSDLALDPRQPFTLANPLLAEPSP